jgi:membrane-associated phospholipid phosphatase
MGELRTSEVVSLVYFLVLAILAWSKPAQALVRWCLTALAGSVGAVVYLASGSTSPSGVALRDWLPVVLLVLAYWAPGALVTGTHDRFERWLRTVDQWLFGSGVGRRVLHPPRFVRAVLEISYASVYPLVPLSIGVVWTAGGQAEVDRFWTTVLTAEYLCYGLLPLLPTRPPRSLEPLPSQDSPRRLNRWVLERFSNGWNTFPSGHVAGSLACGLAVTVVAPVAGAVLITMAVLIAVASVVGRYHYAADAVAGWGVAIGCFAAVRALA